MVNTQTLQGNWNEVKGKLRSKWGQLSNDELQQFDGDVDRLVGLIQRKTGETRSAVEDFLNEVTAEGASMVGRVAEEARRYAHDAGDMLQEGSERAAETLRYGYDEAETMVRQRPVESIAVGFGAGIVVGLLMGLIIQRR